MGKGPRGPTSKCACASFPTVEEAVKVTRTVSWPEGTCEQIMLASPLHVFLDFESACQVGEFSSNGPTSISECACFPAAEEIVVSCRSDSLQFVIRSENSGRVRHGSLLFFLMLSTVCVFRFCFPSAEGNLSSTPSRRREFQSCSKQPNVLEFSVFQDLPCLGRSTGQGQAKPCRRDPES